MTVLCLALDQLKHLAMNQLTEIILLKKIYSGQTIE